MASHLFEPAQARALLDDLRPLVEQLVLAHAEMTDPQLRLRLAELTAANVSSDGIAPLLRPAETVTRLVAEIDGLGVVVRDAASGLLDFPAERDGREVYLCWRLGEENVAHWHPRDDGFAGRRPL